MHEYFRFFCRQIVARTLLETLRAVIDEDDDVEAALAVMNMLADDVGEKQTFFPSSSFSFLFLLPYLRSCT